MGKATIISHKGAGLYEVAINYDVAAYGQRVSALMASLAILDSQLATLDGQISAAAATKAAALAALNDAIDGKVLTEIQSAESKLINAGAVLAGLQQTQIIFKSRRLATNKALETLQSTPPADRLIDAWCADASEDLTGVVGTIDPAGLDSGTVIRPGYEGAASYDASRDGLLRMREHMGPAEIFYNAAVAAGWQIWKPTYRTGILTAVAGDLCSVALDAASLTQQDLNVNVKGESPETVTPVAILDNVPIVYMSCNGDAFTVGDAVTVLLEGQAWSGAKVIGFVRNPKPCTLRGIAYLDGPESAAATVQQFNVLEYKTSAWNKKSPAGKNGLLAGNINWTDAARTLSWWGVSRYFSTISTVDATLRDTIDTGGMMFTAGMGSQVVKGQMYCLKEWDFDAPVDGFFASIKLINAVTAQMGGPYVDELTGLTVSGEDIYGGGGSFSTVDLGSIDNILYFEGRAYLLPSEMGDRINGAAFAVVGAATKLVIVCRENYDTTGHNRSIRNTRESVWVATLGATAITEPVKLATYTYASTPFFNLSPWLFSANGRSAVCHRMAAGVNNPKLCRIEIDAALETVAFFDDGYYITNINTYTYPITETEAVEVIRDYQGDVLTVAELKSQSVFSEVAEQWDTQTLLQGDTSKTYELGYLSGSFIITIDGSTVKTITQSASTLNRLDTLYYHKFEQGGGGDLGAFDTITESRLYATGVTTRHIFLNEIDLRDGYVNLETLELVHGADSFTDFFVTSLHEGGTSSIPPVPDRHGYSGAITCTATHEAFTSEQILFTETINSTIPGVPDSEAVMPWRGGRYGLRFTSYSRPSPLSVQSGSVCYEFIDLWPALTPWPDPGTSFVNHSYGNCDVGQGRLPHFARNWRQMDVQLACTSAFEPGGKRLVVGPKLANARAQIIRYGTDQPNWTQAGAERIGVLQGGVLSQFAAAIVSLPTKV